MTSKVEDLVNELEAIVDRHGLLHVLTGLEIMCEEKAEHIKTNWQDQLTAKPWARAGRKVGKLARDVEPLGI